MGRAGRRDLREGGGPAPLKRTARAADSVDRVYETVKGLAVDFRLGPGERVNEVEMAQRLEVSRTPVRAALNRLVRDGFMTFRPNRGFFVREMSPPDIRDLYELRAAVEGAAIRLACERAADAAIDEAAADWDREGPSLSPLDPERATKADEDLHLAITRMSGNARMVGTIERINSLIHFYRRIDIEAVPRRLDTFVEHTAILDALAARDAELAGDLIQRHIVISAEHAMRVARASLAHILGRAA